MNTTTVIWVTDRHNSSLVTFSLGIAEVTFTVIALAIISGNRWYKSLYPSFLIPHSAQLLLSRGHSHLSLMFPPHSQAFMWQDAASLRFKIFTYSKFLQRLPVPSTLLVCQPEIMLATPFSRVVHPLLFRQDYQSGSLRFLGT